jgi:hypothetical protein
MTSTWSRFIGAVALLVCGLGRASPLHAQEVEVTPFGGYRFGGDFFEIVTQQSVDVDGAPALGVVLNVPLSHGLQVEALLTHQKGHLSTPSRLFTPAKRWHVTVDHYQGGALQEFDGGRVRPFLSGFLGLTRYAAADDNEIRFSIGAGGGVKLFPFRTFGFRLDSRVFATLVDAEGSFIACAPTFCITRLDVDVVWQAEFTAGIVVRFR